MLGLQDCTSQAASPAPRIINQKLDESQRRAVNFALSQNEFCIIDGPPGTGKTTVLVELINQEVEGKRKVLFSAPSNMAVDNMTERLVKEGCRVVRVGHPARVTETCREHTLEYKMVKQLEVVRRIEAQINKENKGFPQPYRRKSRKTELDEKLTQEKDKLNNETKKLLEEADVVLGTLITCGNGKCK